MNTKSAKSIHPLYRWKNGHHLFFVLIQALILIHRELNVALVKKDIMQMNHCFQLATELFWACIGAFRHGTDYAPEEYQEIVRPTMGPPDCSEGFSDLQSVDHSTLLSEMSKLKPLLKNIPIQSESAYKNYTTAVKAVYNNHALVCEQFVGKGPSLKQKGGSTSKEEVALTAPDSIKKIYKARTLKYINRE